MFSEGSQGLPGQCGLMTRGGVARSEGNKAREVTSKKKKRKKKKKNIKKRRRRTARFGPQQALKNTKLAKMLETGQKTVRGPSWGSLRSLIRKALCGTSESSSRSQPARIMDAIVNLPNTMSHSMLFLHGSGRSTRLEEMWRGTAFFLARTETIV